MPDPNTDTVRTGRWFKWLRNHPILSVIFVAGGCLIWVWQVLESGSGMVSIADRMFGRRPTSIEVVTVRVIDDPASIDAFSRQWLGDTLITFRDRGGNEVTSVWGQFPILDVVLRNNSPNLAVVHRVFVHATRSFPPADTLLRWCSPEGPLWAYHILLDADRPTQTRNLAITESIGPGEAARFALVFAHDELAGTTEYQIHADLYYNGEGERGVDLGTHRLRIPVSNCGEGPELPPKWLGRQQAAGN